MSRLRLLVLPLALAVAGCQSVMPGAGGADRAAELERLRSRVQELERQARMNEVEIGRLKRQLAELEQRGASPPPPPSRADAPRRPPAPEERPGVVEPPRPAGGEELASEDLELPPSAPAPGAAPQPAPTPLEGDGQELYDRGYTLYHQGAYVDAEGVFQTFLQRWATSDLADNAQFWIGEARLRRGDVNAALAAFRETVTRYPRGNKVPDALFRSGDCLEKLGDLDGARAAWRQTLERFPNSAAAALSEERLAANR